MIRQSIIPDDPFAIYHYDPILSICPMKFSTLKPILSVYDWIRDHVGLTRITVNHEKMAEFPVFGVSAYL